MEGYTVGDVRHNFTQMMNSPNLDHRQQFFDGTPIGVFAINYILTHHEIRSNRDNHRRTILNQNDTKSKGKGKKRKKEITETGDTTSHYTVNTSQRSSKHKREQITSDEDTCDEDNNVVIKHTNTDPQSSDQQNTDSEGDE